MDTGKRIAHHIDRDRDFIDVVFNIQEVDITEEDEEDNLHSMDEDAIVGICQSTPP